MAWNFTRVWQHPDATPPYGAGAVSITNNSVPAAAGSTLVVLATVRPAATEDPVTLVPSDDLGGTWHQAKDASGNPIYVGAGTSTRYAVFARLNAGGVKTVTVTGAGTATPDIIFHLAEFSGGPIGGEPIWVAAGATQPSGDTWEPVQVNAPASALVVGGASVGVTNRAFGPPGGGFTTLGDYKSGGRHNIAAYRITDTAGLTGPVWTKTSGSSTSLNAVTAAIVGSTGSQPLTVTASTDQEVFTNETATVSASATGGDGAKTFLWTIRSGPAGASLSNSGTASATFNPAGNPGTYVLRCTVTDSTGSAYDEVTVTVLRTLAYQPFATITDTTGWAVTGAANAGAALSDSDEGSYVTSQDNPAGQVLGGTLPPLAIPDQPVVVRGLVRAPAAATGTVVGRLYTGATLRATSAEVPVTVGEDTFAQVDVTFPLSALTGITEADWQSGVRATLAFTAS